MTMPRLLIIPFCLALVLAAWLVQPMVGHSDSDDRSVLGDLISRVLSTPTTRVSIGSVQGALSSDATILNVTISDRDGVWLRLDRARLVWRRLALLSRRLEIDRLEIGQLEVLRAPLPSEAPVAGADDPILPELPVRIVVQDFNLRELVLGESLLGTAAKLTANGAARLGRPSEGLDLKFDARRLDAPGTFTSRLSLVPKTEALTLALDLDEPAGGIAARAMNIPGLPPVRLALKGDGTLSRFSAGLSFDAGPDIGARGKADLARAGDGRRLTLDMQSHVAGLFPATIAPVFAGTTRLGGAIVFADNDETRIEDVSLTSETARLVIGGSISPTYVLDLRVLVSALPTDGEVTRAGQAQIGHLAFDAHITGPAEQPLISADLDVADARLPTGRIDSLTAKVRAVAEGALTERTSRVALTADAQGNGIALTDPALNAAVGDHFTLALKAGLGRNGIADIQQAQLDSPTVEATYAGKIGWRAVDGRARVKLPDLSRFARLSGLALAGDLNAEAKVTGAPRYTGLDAAVTAQAHRFSTGIAPADSLAGGRLDLGGTVHWLPRGGGVQFDDLSLAGAHATARATGTLGADGNGVTLTAVIPDLARADRRMTGKGELSGRLTGPLDKLAASAELTVTDGSALGRAIPRLVVDATAEDLLGAPKGRAELSGRIGDNAATGAVAFRRLVPGGWHVEQVALDVGSVTARGSATIDDDSLVNGSFALRAGNLDDIAPLLLTPLSGDLNAEATFSATNGRQDVNGTAQGSRLQFGDMRIERLSGRVEGRDLFHTPVLNANLAIDRAVIGGEPVTRIRFDSRGSATGSDITATAEAAGFSFEARARLVPSDPMRLEIATLRARRDNQRFELANPATVTMAPGGADVRGVAVAIGSGRLTVDGRVGKTMNLVLAARAIPLAAGDIVRPGLGLTGTLDAEARIGGSSAAPTGEWRLTIARATAPQTRSAGLPPISVTGRGRMDGARTTVEATIDGGRAGTLRVGGSAPLDFTGPLDLTMRGRGDLSVANTLLSVDGRRLTGSSELDLRIRGPIAAPLVEGRLDISGGSFSDVAYGLRLDKLQGRLTARGAEIVVERLSASTPNGGTLAVTGRIAIDPAAGFPGSLEVRGQRAQVMSDGTVDAVVDINATLSGPLIQQPRIVGQVAIDAMQVRIPENLGAASQPLPGTRHINPTPEVRARLAMRARQKRGTKGGGAFNPSLDLAITTRSPIAVSGRGVNAELGGKLMVTGTLAGPQAVGAFDLQRGRFTLGGTQLDFTRGRLTFTGSLMPELDFVAETYTTGITAQVTISGPANEPTFDLSSSPSMSDEEVLSRLLFGSPAGSLSGFQALQLAQIAMQFSGGGGGAFDGLRRSLGLSGNDIAKGFGGGPLTDLARAISNRVNFRVKPGTTAEGSGVGVNIGVSRNIRIQGDVSLSGNTSVGVGAEWEY